MPRYGSILANKKALLNKSTMFVSAKSLDREQMNITIKGTSLV